MKKIRLSQFVSFTFIVLISIGCQSKSRLTPGEGFLEVTGGKVWYRIVGEGEGTPLLLLHGGPGFTSHYLNPMSALGKDRPVIFVDQLGAGRSDHAIDQSMMTIASFVDQINEVKVALGLDQYYIYGHSWGTMLGMDYYSEHPEGIKGLILASPLLSTKMWSDDAEKLISLLPDSIQRAIDINTKNETFESPEFLQAMDVYYQAYVARKLPWDANMDSTFSQMNPEVYNHMWGPSEFRAMGNLKNFDRLDTAKKIAVPTLFLCGEYDEAQPATVKYYQSLVPNSRFTIIENSAHALTHDNPEKHNAVVGQFLLGLDERR
ncbi:MAG: proline iminopeptidase-family hydrolase [Reichenbachiella sp.]|uniref:proline iminopeptidase-family hydrolase n=2 Tax=Reichenbachiella sp. TaxID=2184521 RepID=UPI0032646706